MEEVQKHSLHTLTYRSLKRGGEMFMRDGTINCEAEPTAWDVLIKCKKQSQYGAIVDLVDTNSNRHQENRQLSDQKCRDPETEEGSMDFGPAVGPDLLPKKQLKEDVNNKDDDNNKALVTIGGRNLMVPRKALSSAKPIWHAPWKLKRVISGHGGWVRCIDVDPMNEMFVTGSADRIIKIWNLHTGQLKLSLTGHISTVRGVVFGIHHPYLFSCGDDKEVKCWDLETNKAIRRYHGHLHSVYGIDLHPQLDLLVTCGRDATARLWDMRTKSQIHCLTGHTDTVSQVKCQASEPQIVSASCDSTVRLWDIVAGKTRATLTNHKKSVRGLVLHPLLNMMATGSPDNLKQWKFPEGVFIQNLSGHNAIVNCLAVSRDNVLVSGADNGSMYFWDWKSGYNFQRLQSLVQPGSMECEAGILAMTFDKSGTRLITCESDKTIKMYTEDETATEESHPLNWKAEIIKKRF